MSRIRAACKGRGSRLGRLSFVLIDGNAYARELAATLRVDVEALPQPAGIATILVGDDLSAAVYQRRIDRHARDLGIVSRMERLSAEATLGQVVGRIAEVDADPAISGILVLRPLPPNCPRPACSQRCPRSRTSRRCTR